MSAAIRPYSMAVAPFSDLRILRMKLIMSGLLFPKLWKSTSALRAVHFARDCPFDYDKRVSKRFTPLAQPAVTTADDTLFHMPIVVFANIDSPPMMARTMRERMRPYSTAVAALRSLISLRSMPILRPNIRQLCQWERGIRLARL